MYYIQPYLKYVLHSTIITVHNVFLLEIGNFLLSEVILKQSKAKEFCQNIGPDWDLPDGQTNTQELIEFMNQEKYYSTWILLQRHTLEDWHWVNGSTCE